MDPYAKLVDLEFQFQNFIKNMNYNNYINAICYIKQYFDIIYSQYKD